MSLQSAVEGCGLIFYEQKGPQILGPKGHPDISFGSKLMGWDHFVPAGWDLHVTEPYLSTHAFGCGPARPSVTDTSGLRALKAHCMTILAVQTVWFYCVQFHLGVTWDVVRRPKYLCSVLSRKAYMRRFVTTPSQRMVLDAPGLLQNAAFCETNHLHQTPCFYLVAF